MTETFALLSSAAVLLLAFGLLLALRRFIGQVDGATFVAILFVPLLVYGALSGRLLELTAPGGWGAKFQSTAKAMIKPTAIVEGLEQLEVVAKGGEDTLRQFASRLDPRRPNAVSLEIGRAGYYVPDAIEAYIRTLQSAGSATYVIFMDNATKKFVGSANAQQVLALLDNHAIRDDFMRELQHPGEPPFGNFHFLIRDSLTATETNAEALDRFLTSGADALVVLDQAGKPTHVVDRNRLMTKLMQTLTASTG